MIHLGPLRQIRSSSHRATRLALFLVVLVGASAITMPATASAVPSAGPLGVDVPTGFYSSSAISAFQGVVQQPVNVVQSFVSWQYTDSPGSNLFPYWRASSIIASGETPEITWDPSISGDPSVNQPSLGLAAIINGSYDSYIEQFAQSAAALGQPILLRFAHEMNGSWTSYFEGNSGNTPGEFVQAWRHVWDIFQREGATNVSWVWSPNATNSTGASLAELYPGDQYVNWIGLDGYSYPLEGCQSAQQIFSPALQQVQSFSARPVMLAEVGVDAACANKPALISGLFTWLETEPGIRSITWWERSDGSGDDLVESSSAALTAFQTGVSNWESWLLANPSCSTSGASSGAGDVTTPVATSEPAPTQAVATPTTAAGTGTASAAGSASSVSAPASAGTTVTATSPTVTATRPTSTASTSTTSKGTKQAARKASCRRTHRAARVRRRKRLRRSAERGW